MIKSILGNNRLYADNNAGGGPGDRSLLGYPVVWSNKAAAIASTAVSVYFGNWNYVGKREDTTFGFLRDPYGAANTGQINLYYSFMTVYKVLQAEAIGYADQAA